MVIRQLAGEQQATPRGGRTEAEPDHGDVFRVLDEVARLVGIPAGGNSAGSLLGLGVLSANRELTAVRAAGVSVARIGAAVAPTATQMGRPLLPPLAAGPAGRSSPSEAPGSALTTSPVPP